MFPDGDWNGPVNALPAATTTVVVGAGASGVTVTVTGGAGGAACADVICAHVAGARGVAWTAVEPVREQPATKTAPSATINTALRIAPVRGFMSLAFLVVEPVGVLDGKGAG